MAQFTGEMSGHAATTPTRLPKQRGSRNDQNTRVLDNTTWKPEQPQRGRIQPTPRNPPDLSALSLHTLEQDWCIQLI
ncbi:hypothetical protein ASPCAL01387 [Aspergillus calidoustus]|uniref:Uncharacterized protein n=1 Tax=Aspergillus calidoustus TaxID=454130 RepID=A0A0U5FQN3_ASPCI|nr:hypothetical protein ASPCAL01387 [Aspergillus calidoustus]